MQDVRGDVCNKVQDVNDKVQGIDSNIQVVDQKLDQANRCSYIHFGKMSAFFKHGIYNGLTI